ncbi:hypothetical protein [Helicobacter cetorum]|uniref:hypothetical protein n=1 Tax=Helicobacter cetorum TaxID=138563 RepID=UPI000CF06F3F|nr:hypothetical protein [Helicobacter cetorum]
MIGLRILKSLAPYCVIGVLGFYILNLKAKNAKLLERLETLNSHVILQNESIEKLELESLKYKSLKPLENNKIKEKYQKVLIKDTTCEDKLKSYESLIQAFKKS